MPYSFVEGCIDEYVNIQPNAFISGLAAITNGVKSMTLLECLRGQNGNNIINKLKDSQLNKKNIDLHFKKHTTNWE